MSLALRERLLIDESTLYVAPSRCVDVVFYCHSKLPSCLYQAHPPSPTGRPDIPDTVGDDGDGKARARAEQAAALCDGVAAYNASVAGLLDDSPQLAALVAARFEVTKDMRVFLNLFHDAVSRMTSPELTFGHVRFRVLVAPFGRACVAPKVTRIFNSRPPSPRSLTRAFCLGV